MIENTRAIPLLVGLINNSDSMLLNLDSAFTVPGRDIEVHYTRSNSEKAAASLPNHKLLLDERVHERIKNTNSSDYTWIGNHWTP